MDEWIRWALGVGGALITVICSLVWWDIKRVARNVHKLETHIGELLLPIEKDVRELQRSVDRIEGGQEEAGKWREMVLELIRGRAQ